METRRLTGAELATALAELYGDDWRRRSVEEIGIHTATLYRQLAKTDSIDPALAWGVTKALETEKYLRWRRGSQRNWRAKRKAQADD